MKFTIKKNKFNVERFCSKEKPLLPNFSDEKFKSIYFHQIKYENTKTGGLRFKNIFKKSYKDYPLISVIVPNLNGKNLRNTIDSILKQTYPNIEIIVIDGGSKEQNILFLNDEYLDEVDYWISEKDEGIYDGWNRGLEVALGDYIGIINSNDVFYENAFNYLIKYIKNYSNYDFILGAVEKHKVYAGFRPEEINLRFNIHPSTVVGFFIKLESQKKVGLYNLKYKCSSDYDMFYRLIKKQKMRGIPTKGNEVFGKFELTGYSSTLGFFDHLKEEIQIRYDNKQNIFVLIYIFIGRCFVKLMNAIKN